MPEANQGDTHLLAKKITKIIKYLLYLIIFVIFLLLFLFEKKNPSYRQETTTK